MRQANKTLEVFEKHKRLFNRYPHRVAVKLGFLRDEKTGRRTETWGIVTIVSEIVDQDRLPPEERLPNEIEGVPVQIILAEIAFAGQQFSDAAQMREIHTLTLPGVYGIRIGTFSDGILSTMVPFS